MKRGQIKKIESHLFNLKHYKVAIRNLQKQLDYIMPNITANYSIEGGGGGVFTVSSTTERAAIDRIESRRALNIHEEIQRYTLLIECIHESLDILTDQERHFIDLRYMQEKPMIEVSECLDYSVPHIYRLRDQALSKLALSLSAVVEL